MNTVHCSFCGKLVDARGALDIAGTDHTLCRECGADRNKTKWFDGWNVIVP